MPIGEFIFFYSSSGYLVATHRSTNANKNYDSFVTHKKEAKKNLNAGATINYGANAYYFARNYD